MRCPECDVRNSVAARKCAECGKDLPRKRTPLPFIVGGIVVIGLAGAGLMGIGAAITTKKDPQNDLAAVAKRVAGGPKNPADAEKLKSDLDKALKEYLRKAGAMSTAELATALQTALPTQTYEVHIVELPRGLKIVEIDTMLQASNYLVIKNETDTKVVNIPGLEVCDGAQVINDTAGPVLICVGHTAGQGPRHPQVKVYALMPDAIRDQSEKSVPPIKGEGNAAFAKNNKDVNVEVSLYSIGVAEGAFTNLSSVAATAEDELLKTTLKWDHGKFTGEIPGGRGQLAALHAVARSLKFGEVAPEYKSYLSSNAQGQVESLKSTQPSAFTLSKIKSTSKRRRQTSNRYGLFSPAGSYIVELTPAGGNSSGSWVANAVTKAAGEEIQSAQMPGQPKAMPSAMVPSVVRQNLPSETNTSETSTTATTKTAAPIVERRGEKQIPVKVEEHLAPLKTEPAKVVEAPKVVEMPRVVEKPKKEPAPQIAEAPRTPPKSGLAVSRDPSIKDAPAVTPTPGFIKTSSDPTVQLRRGPSGVYRTVMRLSRGDQVEIIGKRDGWLKVRSNGREGFVPESLISSSKPIGEPTRETAPPRQEAAAPRQSSSSSGTRTERRRDREESRQSSSSRWSSSRWPRKTQESSTPVRSTPHAEEPPAFVP